MRVLSFGSGMYDRSLQASRFSSSHGFFLSRERPHASPDRLTLQRSGNVNARFDTGVILFYFARNGAREFPFERTAGKSKHVRQRLISRKNLKHAHETGTPGINLCIYLRGVCTQLRANRKKHCGTSSRKFASICRRHR